MVEVDGLCKSRNAADTWPTPSSRKAGRRSYSHFGRLIEFKMDVKASPGNVVPFTFASPYNAADGEVVTLHARSTTSHVFLTKNLFGSCGGIHCAAVVFRFCS